MRWSKGGMDRVMEKEVLGGPAANGWTTVSMIETSSRTNVLYTPKASIKM